MNTFTWYEKYENKITNPKLWTFKCQLEIVKKKKKKKKKKKSQLDIYSFRT